MIYYLLNKVAEAFINPSKTTLYCFMEDCEYKDVRCIITFDIDVYGDLSIDSDKSWINLYGVSTDETWLKNALYEECDECDERDLIRFDVKKIKVTYDKRLLKHINVHATKIDLDYLLALNK